MLFGQCPNELSAKGNGDHKNFFQTDSPRGVALTNLLCLQVLSGAFTIALNNIPIKRAMARLRKKREKKEENQPI